MPAHGHVPAMGDLRRPSASARPANVRDGLPPVPGGAAAAASAPPLPAEAPARRGGVPAGVRPAAAPAAPAATPGVVRPSAPVPPLPPHPSLPLTDLPYAQPRPTRTSGPVPPLPGTVPASPGNTKRRRPVKPERSPARRRLVRAVVALAAVLGLLALYNLGLYFYVDRSIDRVEALATDGPELIAPELQDAAETYLVVGTEVPGQKGARSVTAMLATVSGKAKRAVLLSLPPTAMVDTPQCRTAEGELREPRTEALADSLLAGAPSCMVRTVQQLSGLRVDHYLALDLGRLPAMVDALGDVSVCVPGSVAAETAAEPLPLGDSTLRSEQVAGWLRPGEQAADVTGSMVSQRTQLLLTSTLRAALTAGTLTDPLTLTRFLSRASDALTVDQQTTLGDLRALASSLGDLSGSAVQRAELPVTARDYVPAGSKTSYVLLDSAGTGSLFETVIRDTRVPAQVLAAQAQNEATAAAALAAAEAGAGSGEAATGDAATEKAPADPVAPAPLTALPSDITLDVLNATAKGGLARTVADDLEAQGFTVGDVGNESTEVAGTIVRHGPDSLEQARTVAAAIPGATLKLRESVGRDGIQVVIGPNFSKVVPVEVPPAAPAEATGTGGEQPAPSAAAPATPTPAPVSCG
jgi:LCP family protein required for cell wall assembly